MAHSVSAKKRIRQNARSQQRNRARKSQVRTAVRKLGDAVQAGPGSEAETQFRATVKVIDQVAAKGTIHKNKAARLKSRLARKLNAASAKKA